MEDPNRDGKKYSAFLRFVFKRYDLDATARVYRLRNYYTHYADYTLKIEYTGEARTMKQLRTRFDEIRQMDSQLSMASEGVA